MNSAMKNFAKYRVLCSPYDLMHVQQYHYLDDHATYNMMDFASPNPMFSSIDVLPGYKDFWIDHACVLLYTRKKIYLLIL